MASFLNTTANVKHVTPIPQGIPASKGIDLLQDHEFFIKCNPHMVKYEVINQPKVEPIPEDRKVTGISEPKCFKVTDKVHALPAGLWDSDAISTYEFIKLEKGFFMRIRSPLSIVMESVWEIRDAGDGSLQIVEEIVIKCSRLLIAVIKSTCESGWEGIHQKMVETLKET